MLRKVLLLTIAVLLLSPLKSSGVLAQTAAAVSYAAGWNLAGGPVGTDLSAAQALDIYASGAYATPTNSITTLCQGYWAYFNGPTTVKLATAPTAAVQTCPLAAGWNMIGNPFTTAATLPAGTVAYRWMPESGQYAVTNSIPAGGAVWIDASSSGSVTLQSTSEGTSGMVVITTPFAPVYHARVGDTVEVRLAQPMMYTAHADPTYLQFIDSETLLTYPETHFWRWRAIAPGSTAIGLDPACRQSVPPCGLPSIAVMIEISP